MTAILKTARAKVTSRSSPMALSDLGKNRMISVAVRAPDHSLAATLSGTLAELSPMNLTILGILPWPSANSCTRTGSQTAMKITAASNRDLDRHPGAEHPAEPIHLRMSGVDSAAAATTGNPPRWVCATREPAMTATGIHL